MSYKFSPVTPLLETSRGSRLRGRGLLQLWPTYTCSKRQYTLVINSQGFIEMKKKHYRNFIVLSAISMGCKGV